MRKYITLFICIMSVVYLCGLAHSEDKTYAEKSSSEASKPSAVLQLAKHMFDGFTSIVGSKKVEPIRQGHLVPATPPPAQLGSYSLMPPRQKPSDASMRKLLQDTNKK